MSSLNLTGKFYPTFINATSRYSPSDKACIERTVTKLLATNTTADRPGMLLGKIQSGKTKSFMGSIALAFDNGYDVCIVLTKGTKALAKQTYERISQEFGNFIDDGSMNVYDIMALPPLSRWELNRKLILVVKKEDDNLSRLRTALLSDYPALRQKKILMIDDEADFASVGFKRSKNEGIVVTTIARKISELRSALQDVSFLQVTATPYSLYLQPDEIQVPSGATFRPVKPAFTELVPVHSDYVGGDIYFPEDTVDRPRLADFIHLPVTDRELSALKRPDRRVFRLEEALTAPAIDSYRRALVTFVVGAAIRRLQQSKSGGTDPLKNYAFLVHTEAGRPAHEWQETITEEISRQLTAAAEQTLSVLDDLVSDSLLDVKKSLDHCGLPYPTDTEVKEAVRKSLVDGELIVTKVNSDDDVMALLDRTGQLRLRAPMNIFIGGQILDRGITISNLIGFYYGRNPKRFQQDTVLQHSRMYGFRPKLDLAVTRFYTAPQINAAMQRMQESDAALRRTFETNPDQEVVFIQRDEKGTVKPCSPNKILISNTTTLRPFKRILPIGFQTDVKTRIQRVILDIDEQLVGLNPKGLDFDEPFLIPLPTAQGLLKKLEKTLIMEEDEGFTFDWDAAQSALTFLSESSPQENRGKVWCLVRKDRNLSRKVAAGSHATYADAPDTTRTEGAVARSAAIDQPMLMMIRQNGLEEQGWKGTPFYWPVIFAQQKIKTAIYAHDTI